MRKLVAMLLFFCSMSAYAGSYTQATNTLIFSDPTRTDLFISTATKEPKGTVILTHGFIMVYSGIYQQFINRMTAAGYDVVFPQFQEAGLGLIKSMGILQMVGFNGQKVDHDQWTRNACKGIEWALGKSMTYPTGILQFKTRTASQNLMVFGHSIGGTVGYNLPYQCPSLRGKIKGIVMANAVLDPSVMMAAAGAAIPIPTPQTIDVASAGKYVNYPVLFLTGEKDAWGTAAQGKRFMDASVVAPQKRIMTALGNDANHMAPGTDAGLLFDILGALGIMNAFGGAIVDNYLDTDYYAAAALHVMAGKPLSQFAPGVAYK